MEQELPKSCLSKAKTLTGNLISLLSGLVIRNKKSLLYLKL